MLSVMHISDLRNPRKTLCNKIEQCGIDYCVSYNHALIIETTLANAVVENTKPFQGLYVPPLLKKGTFVLLLLTTLTC
ncbi:hypothetical protein E2C01_088756 [Portunus trituberculatus]|uniref:Uncharacterized protein n=1 Tax=Portunus trituberculatus TaxID=210409 RepID=A0A5B7JBM5_PORTR|nr:hypothetical protein [Portunus trituberculatus]